MLLDPGPTLRVEGCSRGCGWNRVAPAVVPGFPLGSLRSFQGLVPLLPLHIGSHITRTKPTVRGVPQFCEGAEGMGMWDILQSM